jgi:transcriptional repressor NrdR
MRCPFCQKDNDKVVDSRASGSAIRRRRECLECRRRYTTYEHIEHEVRLRVIKKDGKREAYDRTKIRRGLMLALHKSKVPTERLDEMLQEIEDELVSKSEGEIPSRTIGDLVMEKLRKEDQVAYVRFASVYRNFKDVSEFVQEVEPMLSKRGGAPRTPPEGRGGGASPGGKPGPAAGP